MGKIYNVPAYLAYQSIVIEVPELGELKVDIAYGGNFYIIVEPQANYKGIEHLTAGQILKYSPQVRDAINAKIKCVHPLTQPFKVQAMCYGQAHLKMPIHMPQMLFLW